jgi:hypothetical protein
VAKSVTKGRRRAEKSLSYIALRATAMEKNKNFRFFAELSEAAKFLADDGHQHVNADRDPYLNLYRVLTCPVRCFDENIII